jgi:hypothetical protein
MRDIIEEVNELFKEIGKDAYNMVASVFDKPKKVKKKVVKKKAKKRKPRGKKY